LCSRDELQYIFPPEKLATLVEKNKQLAVCAMCLLCEHASFPLYLKQVSRLPTQRITLLLFYIF
jgi:hypothetical protein